MDNPATSDHRSATIPAIIKMVPIVTTNERNSLIPSKSGDAGIWICSCKIILPLASSSVAEYLPNRWNGYLKLYVVTAPGSSASLFFFMLGNNPILRL